MEHQYIVKITTKNRHLCCYSQVNIHRKLMSAQLRQAEVPVLENAECEAQFRAGGQQQHIPDTFLCAGLAQGGRDTCEVQLPKKFRQSLRWGLLKTYSYCIVYMLVHQFRLQ